MKTEEKQHNLFAMLAIVISVVGFFVSFWGIIPLAGIILAIIALNQGVTGVDKTLSIISLVLGAIGILYTFMVIM